MEKKFNFRALALIFSVTFAISSSSVNATELSFVAKHKKAIIAGTVLVLTAAATAYYFRSNLFEFARVLLKKNESNADLQANTSEPLAQNVNSSKETDSEVTSPFLLKKNESNADLQANTSEPLAQNVNSSKERDSAVASPLVENTVLFEQITHQIENSPTVKTPKEALEQRWNEFQVATSNKISAFKKWCKKVYNSSTTTDKEVIAEFKKKHNLTNHSEQEPEEKQK